MWRISLFFVQISELPESKRRKEEKKKDSQNNKGENSIKSYWKETPCKGREKGREGGEKAYRIYYCTYNQPTTLKVSFLKLRRTLKWHALEPYNWAKN